MLKKDNRFLIDYLAFSTTIDSPDSLFDLLGFENDFISNFQVLKGFYGYLHRLYYNGIHIHFNGSEDMGICLEMSGTGCRTFEQFGSGNYFKIFDYILSNKEVHITRLDVALDDFEGYLDIETISFYIKSGKYVSRFRSFPYETNLSKSLKNAGDCVYFGSKKSNIMYRLYDKKAEQKAEDLEHWVRLELQLRDDLALSFIDTLYNLSSQSISIVFFGVLNNYIRFVEPSATDSNISRAPLADFWAKFIEHFYKVRLFKPADDFNEDNIERYVKSQCSSSIISFICLFGFDNFKSFILSRSQSALNKRHQAILDLNNIDVQSVLSECL